MKHIFLVICGLLFLSSCGSSGGGIIPAAPSNVRATPDTGAIIVTWQDMSASETGFTIYRETAGANLGTQAFSEVARVGANETSYRDEAIELNTSYRYAVAANGSGGNSAQTAYDTPVSVANKLPVIVYTLDTSIETATLSAEVTDIDGAVQRVLVDWGDSQTDTVTSNFETIRLTHTYTAFATYKVTITATDDTGGEASKSENLEVTAFPTQGLLAEFTTFVRVPSERKMQDSSGNNNHGFLNTSNSTELAVATDRFGLAEKAINFFGSDAGQASVAEIRSDTDSGDLDYDNALSLAVWVTNRAGYIIGPRDQDNVFNSAGLLNSSPVRFEVPTANNGEGYTLEDTLVSNGVWAFYVVTIERAGTAATIKLYKNGLLSNEGSLDDANLLLASKPILVGARASYTGGGGSNDFQGIMDDIRVYNRVLRASEVKALYEDGGWTGNP